MKENTRRVWSIVSPIDQAIIESLINLKQEHLFDAFPKVLASHDLDRFFTQIRQLNDNYPNGLKGYVEKAIALLQMSAKGESTFADWKVDVPKGHSLQYGTIFMEETERYGMEEIPFACFVLVAGGLGERLNYSDIKVSLPVETLTMKCYLQRYIEHILALQKRVVDVLKKGYLPLVIMVSEDTELLTRKLLSDNDSFGMLPGQIQFVRQNKVPCLNDTSGKLSTNPNDVYQLLTKPHGHGDVHMLLHTSGIAQQWESEGRKWVLFFQDTNMLAFNSFVSLLGISAKHDLHMNSVAVPRKAGDASGALMKLEHDDGRSMMINVEYNQLDALLKKGGENENGDVNEKSGYSPFPGNINVMALSLTPYLNSLVQSGGLLGEFVNPKYKDASKTDFLKPARLECLMQEYPKSALPASANKISFTLYEPWLVYSPCKNNVREAGMKIERGIPGQCASVAEQDYFSANRQKLKQIGVKIPIDEKREIVAGISLPVHNAMIVFGFDFAVTQAELKAHFPSPGKVEISSRSSLIVDGAGALKIQSLQLDGALQVCAPGGCNVVVKEVRVTNRGWELFVRPNSQNELVAMRGYEYVKHEQREILVNNSETNITTNRG